MIENALTEYHDRREIERSLAIFHIHNYEHVDIDDVITELAFLKGDVLPFYCKALVFTTVYPIIFCRLSKTLENSRLLHFQSHFIYKKVQPLPQNPLVWSAFGAANFPAVPLKSYATPRATYV